MKNQVVSYKPSKIRTTKILELLPETSGKVILDIGCADGTLGKVLKRNKSIVYGLDISKKDLAQAKKVLDKVFLVDLNTEKIPLPNQSVDIVIASEVIEHLLIGNRLLSETLRILKKDGRLVLTTPNILYWGHRLQFLKGKFEYQKQGPFDQTHVHFYTYSTLKNELEQRGFKITKENHVLLGNKLINFITKNFPSFFAYQLVFKCVKIDT